MVEYMYAGMNLACSLICLKESFIEQTRKEATKSKQALAEDLRQKKILSIVSKLRQRHDELKKKATANSSPPRQEVNTGDKLVSAQCRREEQLEEKLQKLREHHSEVCVSIISSIAV